MNDNQEILTKAIQKAIDGGFNILFTDWKVGDSTVEGMYRGTRLLKDINQIIFNHNFAKSLWGEKQFTIVHQHIAIFNLPGYVDTTHPFHNSADNRMVQEHDMKCLECGKVLKSMWELNHTVCWTEGEYKPGWQYHLQQMVIAEDPIKYLGEHL